MSVPAGRRDVLVLRALGLGDLLTGVPALRGVRDAFPEARLRLACPAWLHGLVHAAALADEAIAARPLEALPAAARRAWLGVNLHGRGPESTRVLLDARPERLVAFRHASLLETAGLPDWRPREPEVARWCRLLSECGIPAEPDRLGLPVPDAPWASVLRGSTVVHPGASAPARRWPWRRWAAVARRERGAGRRVLLTGTEPERPRCLRIAAASGVPTEDVLAGRTSALELAAIVGRAGLVLSGDTGVAHLATAFGTPSVVLFGPVPPKEWGPPPGRGPHRALWAGRRGDPHGGVPDPGLLALTPQVVASEIDELRRELAAWSTDGSRRGELGPGSGRTRRRALRLVSPQRAAGSTTL